MGRAGSWLSESGLPGSWRSWLRDERRVVDIALAVALTVLALADAMAEGVGSGDRALDVAAVALVVVAGSSLVWRRLHPLVVLAIVGLVTITFWLRGHGAFLALLGLPSLYSVAVHESDRRRAWIAMVLMSVVLMIVAGFTVLNPPEGFLYPGAMTMAAYLAAAIGVGVVVRNRERVFADTRRRAEQAEVDRQAAAARAVAGERSRIAREMHDIVAHSMSVIAVQAGAAQEIVQTRPDKVVEVLAGIETVSRESLTEMRRMLGVLRAGQEAPASLLPQPGIRDLQDLIAENRAAGVDVDLVVEGEQRELAPGLELAAYRIVQESLTNVRKHAGPAASAQVVVEFAARLLRITITDNGPGRPTPISTAGPGNGLIGIRERVEIYGGTFSAGPGDDGGWSVKTSLPIAGTDERTASAVSSPIGGSGS